MVAIACRSPLKRWQHNFKKTKKGKNLIVFSDKKRIEIDDWIKNWSEIEIPCGQCIECRLKKAQDWAIRLYKELDKHNYRYFITLTYDNEHMPRSIVDPNLGSLRKKDMQEFLKSWRAGTNKVSDKYKPGNLKYFYCGEYGETTSRPHYHIIAFCDNEIPDLKHWGSSGGLPVWRSEKIEKYWGMGNILIGTVTYESCSYVARYIMKKQLGLTGSIYDIAGILPPYTNMSKGIGNISEQEILSIFSQDYINILKGDKVKSVKPPKDYEDKLREIDPDYYEFIKENRRRLRIQSRESIKNGSDISYEEYRENHSRKQDKRYSVLERSF